MPVVVPGRDRATQTILVLENVKVGCIRAERNPLLSPGPPIRIRWRERPGNTLEEPQEVGAVYFASVGLMRKFTEAPDETRSGARTQ